MELTHHNHDRHVTVTMFKAKLDTQQKNKVSRTEVK